MKLTNLDDHSLTWGELSLLLYELDPARTGCRENEVKDEYDLIARSSIGRTKTKQMPIRQALVAELCAAFECGQNDPILQRVNDAFADSKDSLLSRREKIIRSLHMNLFPEDYDHMGDSIADANDRKRGKDPMSADYRERWLAKRRRLVLTPELNSPDTMQFTGRVYQCLAWYEVEGLLEKEDVDWDWVLAKIQG